MMKIGFLHGERRRTQEILTDITIKTSMPKSNDDTLTVLDYSEIVKIVQSIANENEFKLLEEFAEAIKDSILNIENIEKVTVKVHKPNVPIKNVEDVSVEM